MTNEDMINMLNDQYQLLYSQWMIAYPAVSAEKILRIIKIFPEVLVRNDASFIEEGYKWAWAEYEYSKNISSDHIKEIRNMIKWQNENKELIAKNNPLQELSDTSNLAIIYWDNIEKLIEASKPKEELYKQLLGLFIIHTQLENQLHLEDKFFVQWLEAFLTPYRTIQSVQIRELKLYQILEKDERYGSILLNHYDSIQLYRVVKDLLEFVSDNRVQIDTHAKVSFLKNLQDDLCNFHKSWNLEEKFLSEIEKRQVSIYERENPIRQHSFWVLEGVLNALNDMNISWAWLNLFNNPLYKFSPKDYYHTLDSVQNCTERLSDSFSTFQDEYLACLTQTRWFMQQLQFIQRAQPPVGKPLLADNLASFLDKEYYVLLLISQLQKEILELNQKLHSLSPRDSQGIQQKVQGRQNSLKLFTACEEQYYTHIISLIKYFDSSLDDASFFSLSVWSQELFALAQEWASGNEKDRQSLSLESIMSHIYKRPLFDFLDGQIINTANDQVSNAVVDKQKINYSENRFFENSTEVLTGAISRLSLNNS